MKSSASLRLVSRTDPQSCQPQPALKTLSNALPRLLDNCSTSPTTCEQETLGNKLQRLAILSPHQIGSVELLVDHLLKSAERNGRGLFVLALVAML